MKRIGLFTLFLVFLVFSCGTTPSPIPQPEPPELPVEPVPTVPEVSPVEPVMPVEPVQEVPVVEAEPEIPPVENFNPETISEERFDATREDVRFLIEDLNRIIRARDYDEWLTHLSGSYFEEISSRSFLAEITEDLYKRDQMVASSMGRNPRLVQKKNLRTPRDYFVNVVVPSRSNDSLDDIVFVSENRVRAYTVDARRQRVVLYDLEMIDDKWKIIN